MKKLIVFIVVALSCSAIAQKRLVVAQDGSGTYKTVQEALNAVPLNNTSPILIFIKNGTYREKLHLDSTKNFVKIQGESNTGTMLVYDDHPGKISPTGGTFSSRSSYSFIVLGND